MGLASKLRKNQPQPPAAQPPPAPMGYGATQSATTDSFRGNHPSAPPYGAAPPPGGQSYGAQQQYGAAPPSGGYGAQATGGYGGAPPAGGYGAPPAGGYGGAQPPTGGYGGAQGAGGYGGAGGYNAAGAPQYGTQSTGGYGGAQGAGGYGGAPPATGGYGGAPGGYGAPQFGNSQGGYPGGGGYGNDFGAAPAPGGDARIYNVLKRCVDENRLQRMYTDERLRHLSSQLLSLVPRIQAMAARWRISDEVMYDLFKIALYDVHLLCDDSGSMIFQENGERINDLKVAISYVAECCSIFDLDGIQVRFLNSTVKGDHITDGAQVEKLISEVRFSGVTPIGTALENAILRPYFYEPMRQNTLQKPLLVICITDGSPAGEPADAIFKAIRQTAVYHTSLGKAVAFSFAQVGNDQDAQKFLQTLDKHPEIGECVDVTSNYELEETELARKGAVLTPEMWIAKLLLGPIDASYDRLDE